MTNETTHILQQLMALDFSDKGEAFVESRFVTPLLGCLGYETHRDYEVARHGDEGAGFKLSYPPVEKGAKKVKHYNPDYAPKIRKKMFWIIEAKSAKDVSYPFDLKYLVQGLQYCIHPEIQAKYLLVTNGAASAVYDAQGGVFLGRDVYTPILEFRSVDLLERWSQIFELLSVDRLRGRIEVDLKAMFDKLCLSSLDAMYPRRLLGQIGASVGDNARQIEQHVRELYLEEKARQKDAWRSNIERQDAKGVYAMMDMPLPVGPRTEGHFFVDKSRAEGRSWRDIFAQLTENFAEQGIFRKVQTFAALCLLYQLSDDAKVKEECRAFFDRHKDSELPLVNQVECAALRLTRKRLVLFHYPGVRESIKQQLASAPELVRFVNPPNALEETYFFELVKNRDVYDTVRVLDDAALQHTLSELLKLEGDLEGEYRNAKAALSDWERELSGFDSYGVGGKHYAFKNMLINFGIDQRD